jgi:hypothetical protein
MAAKSSIPTEIEEWIIKMIDSCTTVQQVVKCRKLIDLYIKKLSNETELSCQIRSHIRGNLINYYKEAKLKLIRN